MVALEVGIALLGVDGDAAVVAYALVGAAGEVEERRLAAVGIAHQRHIDVVAGGMGTVVCGHGHVLRLRDAERLRTVRHHLNLLYLLCLLAAQAHLVAHHPVLDRVLQGCAQQHIHLLSLDKAHLNDALTEATVTFHLDDIGLVACLQFRESHTFCLFAGKGTKLIRHMEHCCLQIPKNNDGTRCGVNGVV